MSVENQKTAPIEFAGDLNDLNNEAKRQLNILKESTTDNAELNKKLTEIDSRIGLLKLINEETKNPQHAHINKLISLKNEVNASISTTEKVVDYGATVVSTVGSAVGTAATTVNDVGVATTNALADRALPKDYANAVKELPDYAKVPLLGGAIYVTAKAVKWMFEAVGWEKGAEHVDKWGAGLGKWIGIIGVGLGIKNFVSPKTEETKEPVKVVTPVAEEEPKKSVELTKEENELVEKISDFKNPPEKEETKKAMKEFSTLSIEKQTLIMSEVFKKNNALKSKVASMNTADNPESKNFKFFTNTMIEAQLTSVGLTLEDGKLLCKVYRSLNAK